MSYIDREALIDRLCYICGADCDKNLCPVKQTVEYMPDADVEPIRYGEWIMKPDPYGFFGEIPVCSVCGCTTKMRETYNYCPNCGAKMKENTE